MVKRLSPATVFVLKSLIPYSKESMLLGFSPNRFFNELEHLDKYSRKEIRNSFYNAKRNSYITDSPIPKLTAKGRQRLQPYIATKLKGDIRLMVIFDIPEEKAWLRRRFRTLLRELKFKQTQQSVWVTVYDHREVLREACNELELHDYVQVHESALLFPN